MTDALSRRDFLIGLGAAGAAGFLVNGPLAAQANPRITFGCAAITWGGNDLKAIEDVASLGYPGIQLRSNILEAYGDRPDVLRELLQKNRLTMVALSSGNVRIDPAVEKKEIDKHVGHAKFVRDVGGLYLQLTDERPKGRPIVADDYKRLARLLTEIGKRTADLGIPVGFHNHMNNLGERPDEVRWILDAADPRYVKLQLDTAHYQQGGGDPVAAVREYRDRLIFLHIKDLEAPVPGATGDLSRSYRFVELGRGKVDLPGFFTALREVGFQGWAVVELDRVPDPSRTPKEAGAISKRYIEEKLGLSVGAATSVSDNQLTDAEKRAGWMLLFDGRTLDGWRGYKRPDASATRWTVVDGMMTVPPNDGKDTRGARDLITAATFDQFELTLEWKVSPGGNSGVKYFVLEDMDSAIGHEYQIIDDERHADALIGPERQTSAFYDVLAASNRPIKPAGEFNSSRILVSGHKVEHWLNGTQVLEYELDSPALRAAIEDSKFKGVARFGKLQKGHILLQDHGDQVWYRNVKIRARTT
ncbi:MAG: family 16 glycoside hydrolase [Vicinamibacterales bacterium]